MESDRATGVGRPDPKPTPLHRLGDKALCCRIPALRGTSTCWGRGYFHGIGQGSPNPLLPGTTAGVCFPSLWTAWAQIRRPLTWVPPPLTAGLPAPAPPLLSPPVSPISCLSPPFSLCLDPSFLCLLPPRNQRPQLSRLGYHLRAPSPPPLQPFVSRRSISWVAERLCLRISPRPASSEPGSAPPAVSPPLPPRRPCAP